MAYFTCDMGQGNQLKPWKNFTIFLNILNLKGYTNPMIGSEVIAISSDGLKIGGFAYGMDYGPYILKLQV